MSYRSVNPQTLQLLAIDAFFEFARAGHDSADAMSVLYTANDLSGDMTGSPSSGTRERVDSFRVALQRHAESVRKTR